MFVGMKYAKHFFVCQNERNDPDRKSCGKEHAQQLIQALRDEIRGKNLPASDAIRVRVQACACLDACAAGPTLVVYPEGAWYGGVQTSDARAIVDAHLGEGPPVGRLRIFPATPPDPSNPQSQ